MIVRGFRHDELIVRCGVQRSEMTPDNYVSQTPHLDLGRPVPFPVARCTHYEDKRQETPQAMANRAWILDGTHTKVKGFKQD